VSIHKSLYSNQTSFICCAVCNVGAVGVADVVDAVGAVEMADTVGAVEMADVVDAVDVADTVGAVDVADAGGTADVVDMVDVADVLDVAEQSRGAWDLGKDHRSMCSHIASKKYEVFLTKIGAI